MKVNVYEKVTAAIVAALERGTIPWRKPWTGIGSATNISTKKAYRGLNHLLLGLSEYGSNYWATYKQAQVMGGQVRKGEKGRIVVFWKMLQVEKEGTKKEIPFLRYSTVFNFDQIDWEKLPNLPKEQTFEFEADQRCQDVVDGYPSPPSMRTGTAAFYRPADDTVVIPRPQCFQDSKKYYSTTFHELIHSTGHKSRLNRPGIENIAAFGSETYSKEELIAEMGAAFLCAHAGIDSTLDHSASYINSWIRVLKGDSRLAVQAAGAAQRAADHILG